MYAFVRNKTADLFNKVCQWFVSNNNSTVTNLIITDKDLSLISAVRRAFPSARHLLCRFHVLRAMRKKIKQLKATAEVKSSLLEITTQMVYSKSNEKYDKLYNDLTSVKNNEFKNYFDANWHNCVDKWSLFTRQSLLTLGIDTNNRIENFNRQLKAVLRNSDHLSLSLAVLINFEVSLTNDIGFRVKQQIELRTDSRISIDALSDLNAILTTTAADLVTEQYRKSIKKGQDCKVTENSNNAMETENNNNAPDDNITTYTVQLGRQSHTVSNNITKCDCSFVNNFALPCWHIIVARIFKNVPYFDNALHESIPERWLKCNVIYQDMLFTPSNANTIT